MSGSVGNQCLVQKNTGASSASNKQNQNNINLANQNNQVMGSASQQSKYSHNQNQGQKVQRLQNGPAGTYADNQGQTQSTGNTQP